MAKQAAAGAGSSASKARKKAANVVLVASVREPSHTEIAARAYALYQARGAHDGGAFHDWVRAENELRQPTS
jgi:Protein of unknown function (DUF2934)